ncbi:uncharacterized protein LOC108108183 [Drosophila eugracilis]|uniref:uncharacterized protein LOC108108183 n=1 Tax=Drosophila eugracilis TaxID=29029 RepID=UPI0007E7098D|nr:uncharacterized protein LOC108108183 [Drosophila eugracilis]
MCNLNQMSGGWQRYHYSCCRQRMHPNRWDNSRKMVGTAPLKNTKESKAGMNFEDKSQALSKPNSVAGKVSPRTSSTGKKVCEGTSILTSLYKRSSCNNSLTSQVKQRSKGSVNMEDELLSATNSNFRTSNMKVFPNVVTQKKKTPSEAYKNMRTYPKAKPVLEEDKKALVKSKPKRKKIQTKKIIARSTAGNIDEVDDGIWFECNVPFRVNIPFPFSIKNLFGFQSFPGNNNLQSLKAVVPARPLQRDRKVEWPFNFSMFPAITAPDPASNTSSGKALTLPKKKGLRRGRKCFPCETATQTTEDGKDDPVLCCLEQIRNQLAVKSPENHEKNLSRFFSEKSTNVRSIQRQKIETDLENTSKSTIKDYLQSNRASENGSFKQSQKRLSSVVFQNILPKPNSKARKMENKNKLPKTMSKSNSRSSLSIRGSRKDSQTTKERTSGSILDVDDKENDLVNPTKEVPKSPTFHTCHPHILPKFTRVVLPRGMYPNNFMNRCPMMRWQCPRQPHQQYYQPQKVCKPTFSTTAPKETPCNTNKSCQDNKSNDHIYLRKRSSSYNPSTESQKPKEDYSEHSYDGSYSSSRAQSNYDSKNQSLSTVRSRSYKTSNNTISKGKPSDRDRYSDRSNTSYESLEKSSQKKQKGTSSYVSLASSRRSSTRSTKYPKSVRSSNVSEVEKVKLKKEVSQKSQNMNKPNQQEKNRISSGGETCNKEGNNNEICEEMNSQFTNSSQYSSLEAIKAEKYKCDKNGSDISKVSERSVSERKERKYYRQSTEKPIRDCYIPYRQNKGSDSNELICRDQGIENSDESKTESYATNSEYTSEELSMSSESLSKDRSNQIPVSEKPNCIRINQNRNVDRGSCYRQRSQSAPECWILHYPQRNHINRSEKSYLCQPFEVPSSSRNKNCTVGGPTCPETVLVLQDETCESESDDYEFVPCNKFLTQMGGEDVSCKTADYSINPEFLKQFANQESPGNKYKESTLQPRENQCVDDSKIVHKGQERENPPLVLVPFRMNDIPQPKALRDLGLKLAMLNQNQMQMTAKTTKSQRKSFERIENNIQNTTPESSSRSSTRYSPSSRSNTSIESRIKAKAQEYPSYTVLRGSQKDSINSCNSNGIKRTANDRQREEDKKIYFENDKKRTNPNESDISYRQSQVRSDNYNRESHQSFKTIRKSGMTVASGYSAVQSNHTSLTWTQPEQNSHLEVRLTASGLNKTIERSNATTDVETLETVTLMQPRKLRSSDSAAVKTQFTGIENTVLMETRTPCKRENLLQTCGRPPCNFCLRQYTGLPPSLPQGFMITSPAGHPIQPQISMSAPQYRTQFDENYLIDPRDQWRTVKSPASAPVMNSQIHQHQPTNMHYTNTNLPPTNISIDQYPRPLGSTTFYSSGHYPQTLQDNIKMLPEGFYDRTVNKYKIARMDSNFQPPSLRQEFLQAQQYSYYTQPPSPYDNPYHHHLMIEPNGTPNLNRSHIPPQNQCPSDLQYQPSMFCPKQSVKLDDYDQSEYQI